MLACPSIVEPEPLVRGTLAATAHTTAVWRNMCGVMCLLSPRSLASFIAGAQRSQWKSSYCHGGPSTPG